MSDTGSAIGSAAGSALGPVGTVLGGLIGGLFGGTDHGAEDRMKAMQEAFANLASPNFDFSKLTPEQKQAVGLMSPEAMQALQMQPAQTIQDNGQGRAAQLAALQQMSQLSRGGLNLQDKADLLAANNSANQQNKAAQDAILASQRARGMSGGGNELAARMIAQQGSANTASQMSNQAAANAQNRALQAMTGMGQAGADLRGADNNLSAQNANIINAFNQANFANQQGIANQNVANRNAAQGFNLSNAQNLSNSNVDTNNAFKQYNQMNTNNLLQQGFANNMAKLNGQMNAAQQAAYYQNGNAAGDQSRTQGLAQALGGLAGWGAGQLFGSKPATGTPVATSGYDPTKLIA